MQLRSDALAALAVVTAVGLAIQSDVQTTDSSLDATAPVHVEATFAEVLPILEKHCWECHSEENAELGLKLDTYEGVMAGSDYGTVVEAGDADGSLLVDMIASGDMPEDADAMPAEELAVIKAWINEGATNN